MIIKKELDKQYIILDNYNEDSFYIKMMLENTIPGLIGCKKEVFNGEALLYYDITGKTALSDFTNKLSGNEIESLLHGIYLCQETLSDYFLKATHFSYGPDTIFYERGKWFFCYFEQEIQENNVNKLAEFLLSKACSTDEKATLLAFQFYQEARNTSAIVKDVIHDILYPYTQENTIEGKIINKTTTILNLNETETEHSIDETENLFLKNNGLLFEGEKSKECSIEQDIDQKSSEILKTDWLTVAIFTFVFMISMVAGIIFGLQNKISDIMKFIEYKEGILSIVFTIIGFLGMLWEFFPIVKGFLEEKEKPQDIEVENTFKIPPIDKI